jgi:hypothetical protein
MSEKQLTTGEPVLADRSHTAIDPATGQQRGYVVLTPAERAKGFVKPVREKYRHVGAAGPRHPLRDLTAEELERYAKFEYVKFEAYPLGESALGRYWTEADLAAVRAGCRTVTTMARSIAETYARDPHFYSGTFCATCRSHFPLKEFIWEPDGEPMDPALQAS